MKRTAIYLLFALLGLVGCRAQHLDNPDSEWVFGLWAPETLGAPTLYLGIGYQGDNIYQYRYPNPVPPSQQDSGTFTMDTKSSTIVFTNTATHVKRTVTFSLGADHTFLTFFDGDGARLEIYHKLPIQ